MNINDILAGLLILKGYGLRLMFPHPDGYFFLPCAQSAVPDMPVGFWLELRAHGWDYAKKIQAFVYGRKVAA